MVLLDIEIFLRLLNVFEVFWTGNNHFTYYCGLPHFLVIQNYQIFLNPSNTYSIRIKVL